MRMTAYRLGFDESQQHTSAQVAGACRKCNNRQIMDWFGAFIHGAMC